MDSPLPTLLPISTEDLRKMYDGYQQALTFLPPATLMAELARVNALIENQSSNLLTGTLWQASHSEIDRPDLSPEPLSMGQSQPGHDRPLSPRSPAPTSAISLLAGTGRIGPRLAAKLVVSSARAQSHRQAR